MKMTQTVFIKLGFAAGLLKAAAAGDNQPGPMPGRPAAPDSHRKRNVALGAAVLAGGALGTRFARGANQMAMQVAKQQRQQAGSAILGRMRQGHAAGAEAGRWMQQNKTPIGVRERAGALAGHIKQRGQKAMAPSRELYNQRFMARHNIQPAGQKPGVMETTKFRDKKKSILHRAKWVAAGTGGAAIGAAAGASAASKAREPQSNDQPGLG